MTLAAATADSDRDWRARVDDYAAGTLFGKADSWYMAANVPGKPRQMINYPRGMPDFLAQWREARDRGYAPLQLA